MKWLLPALLTLVLAACSTAPKKSTPPHAGTSPSTGGTVVTGGAKDCSFYAPAQEDLSKRGNYTAGGLYAPGVADTTPDHLPDLDCIREPVVSNEPRSPIGNRSPYSVLGKQYRVMDDVDGYVETGTASYYGNKFHGRRTSNQEVYDMYAFTAAHKTLPLPSFARVTNLDNGKSVVVRVNDRGPFHEGRVIDLSYAAAVKLGITQRGTGRVEVRAVTSNEVAREQPRTQATVASTSTSTSAAEPARASADRQATPQPAASGMDTLVRKLPAVDVSSRGTAQAQAASGGHRYYVAANASQPADADRFEAWMEERGVRIATGKPTPMPAAADHSDERAAVRPATSQDVAREAAPRPATSQATGSALQLQVGSFASRENADRALARLLAAGIADATLSDVHSNGRVLWRLRVGAASEARADELAGRIAGLGFDRPQRVRE